MLLIALSLGSLIGLVLGLTGAGGGILAVPALTLGLGWSMTQASPIALLAVGSAAAIGVLSAHQNRLVRYRAAMLISINGMIAAPLGQYLAHRLPERALTLGFAVVMIIVAARLWRSVAAHTLSDDSISADALRPRRINIKTGRIQWNRTSFITLSIIGLLTGLTTGLLGVGGGFIIVPALLRCSNITLEGIVATSLLVISLVSLGAFVSAVTTGDVTLTLGAGSFVLGAAAGMLLGRHFSGKLPKHIVLRLLAVLIIAVSLVLLYRKFWLV